MNKFKMIFNKLNSFHQGSLGSSAGRGPPPPPAGGRPAPAIPNRPGGEDLS